MTTTLTSGDQVGDHTDCGDKSPISPGRHVGPAKAATCRSTPSSTLIERREYDSFGNMIMVYRLAADATLYAKLFYGFSTKWRDPESELLYYGYRYYNPNTQRWLNRDPIEEAGGINLYGFVGNDGVNQWDLLGNEVIVIRVAATDELGNGTPKSTALQREVDGINQIFEKNRKKIDQFITQINSISENDWSKDGWKWSFNVGRGVNPIIKGNDKSELLKIANKEKESTITTISSGGIQNLEKALSDASKIAGPYAVVVVSMHAAGTAWFPDGSDAPTTDVVNLMRAKLGKIPHGLIACGQRKTGVVHKIGGGLATQTETFLESFQILPDDVDSKIEPKPGCNCRLKALGVQRGLTRPGNEGQPPEKWDVIQ